MCRPRFRPTHLLSGVVVMTVLAVSACSGSETTRSSGGTSGGSSGGTSATTTPGTVLGASQPTNPFYQPPTPLPAGKPGDIIRSEPMTGAPAGAQAYRVLYHSTGLQGQDIAVSGVIIVPAGTAPSGGRPVVTWAHPTSGVVDPCAPSYSSLVYELLAGVSELLQAGYVIAATDYEGLGTPGVHPYLVGISEGRGTLDAARAAVNLSEAGASARTAIWGWSQGGQASLFAGELAPAYAPELEVVGVAAAAPAGELAQILKADENTVTGVYLGAYALNAYEQVYGPTTPGLDVNALLTPAGQQALAPMVELCNVSQSAQLEAIATPLVGKFYVGDPGTVPPWSTLMQQNTPGQTKTVPPIFIAQGTEDTVVPPATTQQLVKSLCGLGDRVQLDVVDGASHNTVAFTSAPTVATWIAARFAGQPATSTCT